MFTNMLLFHLMDFCNAPVSWHVVGALEMNMCVYVCVCVCVYVYVCVPYGEY